MTVGGQLWADELCASLLDAGWQVKRPVMYSSPKDEHEWEIAREMTDLELIKLLRSQRLSASGAGVWMKIASDISPAPTCGIRIWQQKFTRIAFYWGSDCPVHRLYDRAVDPSWALDTIHFVLRTCRADVQTLDHRIISLT